MKDERIIQHLNFLTKTYDGITKLIAATKQRLLTIPGINEDCDTLLKGIDDEAGLLTIKGRAVRAIEKELAMWDIWNLWLKKIPGIGPDIASKLILLFYYKFIPICKECGGDLEKVDKQFKCLSCGKTAKGDGVLKHRIEFKDFPTVSKWWAYMGRHTVDGVMPKRKKDIQANWSTQGRTVGFHIGDQFNRQKPEHSYKAFLLERRAKHERTNPEWSKGHNLNASRNEAAKLFLSHFWHVARTLEGKETKGCYAEDMLGHNNIIAPYYWQELKKKKAA